MFDGECRLLDKYLQTSPRSDKVWAAAMAAKGSEANVELQMAVLRTRIAAAIKQKEVWEAREASGEGGRIYVLLMAGKGKSDNYAGERSKYGALNCSGSGAMMQVLHLAARAAPGLGAGATGGGGFRVFLDANQRVALCALSRVASNQL